MTALKASKSIKLAIHTLFWFFPDCLPEIVNVLFNQVHAPNSFETLPKLITSAYFAFLLHSIAVILGKNQNF